MSGCFFCCMFYLFAGIIYPLSQTYQAYKLQEKLQLWSVYWIIMSSIYLVEQLTFGVLNEIPGYELLKILYGIWLYHEKTQGAIIIGKAITPVLNKVKDIVQPFQGSLSIIEQAK